MASTIRTIQLTPIQNKYTGKWACVFRAIGLHNGEEYTMAETQSGAVWSDEHVAREAGKRVLKTLEETGAYPNMCQVW